MPRVQFIGTTHDPLCLRGLEDGEVIVLQRDEVGQIISIPNLPSIKGMRADQLLTSDFFGLSSTVDPETELDVARFVEAVGDLPAARVEEANRLVRQLVLGDDAIDEPHRLSLRVDQRLVERVDRRNASVDVGQVGNPFVSCT